MEKTELDPPTISAPNCRFSQSLSSPGIGCHPPSRLKQLDLGNRLHGSSRYQRNTDLRGCLYCLQYHCRFGTSETFFFCLTDIFFFFFWLHWVFIAVCGLSLVAVSRGYSSLQDTVLASHCSGFSCCRALGPWAQ